MAATEFRRRDFYTRTPLWVLILIPLGLLVAIVVSTALRKTVHAQLPGCPQCRRDRRKFVALVCGVWVLDMLTLALAAAIGAVGLVLWLVVTLVALAVSFGGDRYRVSGVVSADGAWVTLKGTNDAFAAAINTALRMPPPPPPPYAVAGQTVLPQ